MSNQIFEVGLGWVQFATEQLYQNPSPKARPGVVSSQLVEMGRTMLDPSDSHKHENSRISQIGLLGTGPVVYHWPVIAGEEYGNAGVSSTVIPMNAIRIRNGKSPAVSILIGHDGWEV